MVIISQHTHKSSCCILKTNTRFYANNISIKLEKSGLRIFHFIKQMRKPRKKLVAEPKSEGGIGLIGQDSVVDWTVLFCLCFACWDILVAQYYQMLSHSLPNMSACVSSSLLLQFSSSHGPHSAKKAQERGSFVSHIHHPPAS